MVNECECAGASLVCHLLSYQSYSSTTKEAQRWWAAIEPQTSDATLKEAMTRTLLGKKQAADQKDAKVMTFGADIELILVDGLETFFLAHPHRR